MARRNYPVKQHGVALITALLVVVLATIAAVAMTSRQQLDIRRTENILRHGQAYLYLLGAEDWAVHLLAQDLDANKIDTFNDDWSTVLPPMPIEGGQIRGEITDLQGRFNINSLLKQGAPDKQNIARFERLLGILGVSPTILDGILDWLDADETARLQGAEDGAYLGKTPAYRAANRTMSSPTELLYINGISYEIYEKLAPFVTALPDHTDININTASPEILAALDDSITLEAATTFTDVRGKDGYATVDDFLKSSLFNNKKVQKSGLSVTSQYFQLSATVIIGDTESQLTSTVKRNSSKDIVILSRSQG